MAQKPTYPVRKLVLMSDDMVERIADYRFSQRIQSENEAIRRLIDAGLRAEKARRLFDDSGVD